jgi:uncharacterized coiled-coil protein SlyX
MDSDKARLFEAALEKMVHLLQDLQKRMDVIERETSVQQSTIEELAHCVQSKEALDTWMQYEKNQSEYEPEDNDNHVQKAKDFMHRRYHMQK